MVINEELLTDIRQYVLYKTGKNYLGRIKKTGNNIMVSCPYHKDGQENRPSCGIKINTDQYGYAGQLHCFTCGKTTDIGNMIKYMLGPLYDENEVESRFQIDLQLAKESLIEPEHTQPLFRIPDKKSIVDEETLAVYRQYHPYLASRNITIDTANMYDIGYDTYNRHITFPIRDVKKQCLGLGRRSIDEKKYIYPQGFKKPLYGVYELPNLIRHLYCVEGPFNLWSLYQYKKSGVAMLGTGTHSQYDELLAIKCDDYILALDGDDAGRNGTFKLGTFLEKNNRKVYVANVPDNQDINDMTENQFRCMEILDFKLWKYLYKF